MAQYSCLKVFEEASPAAVPFDQVISDIRDARTGVLFAPHTFLFYNATAPLNTMSHITDLGGLWNNGMAIGMTSGAANGVGSCYAFGFAKRCSGCGCGIYCLVTNGPNPFFGGSILSFAYISAIAVGSITLTWDKRDDYGGFNSARIMLALGGDDWDIVPDPGPWNSVHTTPSRPAGVLCCIGQGLGTSKFASTGAGSITKGIGWASRDGHYGSSVSHDSDPPLSRAQQHDRVTVTIVGPDQTSGTPIVSAWGDLSWTGAGYGGTSGEPGQNRLQFCGPLVVAKSGTFDTPAEDGSLSIDLGVDPAFVVFASVGAPDSPDVETAIATQSVGFTDRTHMGGLWTGETSRGGDPYPDPPLVGANYTGNDLLICSATPAASATVRRNVMTMTPITGTNGFIEVTFTDTDGTQPNVEWFAVGLEPSGPPPPPPPDRRVIRRLRQFAHLNETNLLLFVDQLEVYLQAGVGNAEAPDPQMMLQYSKDGGETWSAERWMSAGKVGEFTKRLRWMQLGQSRDWVFRFVVSDPVIWDLVDCFANVRQGSS